VEEVTPPLNRILFAPAIAIVESPELVYTERFIRRGGIVRGSAGWASLSDTVKPEARGKLTTFEVNEWVSAIVAKVLLVAVLTVALL